MTIDPTKDIVTEEEYSRPVMMLYALGNDTPYGFVVYDITKTHADKFWLTTDENRPDIRNVAPPECEQWAAKASAWAIEKDALRASLEEARQQRDNASIAVETWKAKAEAMQAEVERMKPFNRDVEVLCHQHGLEKVGLQVELGKLKDEAESMKPVVDAAVAWVLPELRGLYTGDTQRLIEAVRAYNQSPKKTAAAAVANVAKMMGPVKSCATCRWDRADHPCCGCRDNDFWEPRHD